jgi:SAM-dependent methyltransferase
MTLVWNTDDRFALMDHIVKRKIVCNLCGSVDQKVLFPDELGDQSPSLDYAFTPDTRKTYQIVECKQCGLRFYNPMPYLSRYYAGTRDETYLKSKKQRLITAQAVIRKLLKYKEGGKLLDVGCNTGILLEAASAYFNVRGIELSRWSREIASDKYKIYDKPLSRLKLKNEFDVISLMGVIEHLEDPRGEILAIYQALKPNGVLMLYTGDFSAFLPRILAKKWWWYQGMHTFYFSKETCKEMLAKSGFECVQFSTHTTYFQLFSLAVSLNRYKAGQLISWIFKLSPFRNIMIPLRLSGEMLVFARKS